MNDHAPRLRAQQQKELENAEMAELERRSAPLMWATCATILIMAFCAMADGVIEHFNEYAELAAQQEAMIQCINGKAIGLDDAMLRCEVRKYQLISEVQP